MSIASDLLKLGQSIESAIDSTRGSDFQLTDRQLDAIAERLADRLAKRSKVMTYPQLSAALQISEATLRRYKNAGTIPFIGTGDTVRFDFDAVVRALSKSE